MTQIRLPGTSSVRCTPTAIRPPHVHHIRVLLLVSTESALVHVDFLSDHWAVIALRNYLLVRADMVAQNRLNAYNLIMLTGNRFRTLTSPSAWVVVALLLPELIQCGGKSELASTGDAGASCSISVGDYDNSCKADSDCKGVPDTNPCLNECRNCLTSALNVQSAINYMADYIALSPGHNLNTPCNCPDYATPCCRDGICSASNITCHGPK